MHCLFSMQMLREADEDGDGLLTWAEWAGTELWFQYKGFTPGSEQDLEAQHAQRDPADDEPQFDAPNALKRVLWELFSDDASHLNSAAASTSAAAGGGDSAAASGSAASSCDALNRTRSMTRSSSFTKPGLRVDEAPAKPMKPLLLGATLMDEEDDDFFGDDDVYGRSASNDTTHGPSSPGSSRSASPGSPAQQQNLRLDFTTLLLYLCGDRDMFAGIRKAFSVVTANVAINAHADGPQVARVAYPAGTQAAGDVARLPFTPTEIAGIVAKVAESRGNAPGPDGQAIVSAEQLMYSAAGDQLVKRALYRYGWKDAFVATQLM